MLDIHEIKKCLPHRFPFLLVDRVIEIEKGRRVVGIKNITGNDYYNHQNSDRLDYLFPGALQVEAMAQMAGFVILSTDGDNEPPIFLLAQIESARFRMHIRPGDQLRIEVELKKFKANTGKFYAKSYIGDRVASEVHFTCMMTPT